MVFPPMRSRLDTRHASLMAAPTPESVTAAVAALLAGSEILSLVPGIRANGWIQLILAAMRGIASRKR